MHPSDTPSPSFRRSPASVARAVLWSAALLSALALRAAEGDAASGQMEAEWLPAMVVTGLRSEREAFTVPFSIDTVSAERLRTEQMAGSLQDALLETPAVLVQQTARGQGSPYLRGFTGFRTLALVDGIRLNNSTFRDGPNQYWSTIDSLAIGQLEVMRGPAGVMYGSDAIGGTVNALMSPLPYGPGAEVNSAGAAFYRFGSADTSHVARVQYGQAKSERWAYSVGISGKSFDDLNGGDDVGLQPYSGYNQWDGDAKAEFFLADQTRLTVAYQRTQQDDVKRTHRTPFGLTWEGLSRGSDRLHEFDQLRELTYARITTETGRGDTFSGTVSWQRQNERQWVQRSNGSYQRNAVDVDTVGLTLQGISPSPVGQWTYGVEHYHDFVGSAQSSYSSALALTGVSIQGPVADDSDYDLFGAYVQDEIPLPARFRLFLGGRFSWARADAGIVRDPVTGSAVSFADDWNNASGTAQLLWHPDEAEKWGVYSGVAQGFRAPNLSDLTRFDIARSGEIETAALGLDPEEFVSAEVGIKTDQQLWTLGASYYRTFINDMIVRTPTGQTVNGLAEVTKRNGSTGWVQGVEISGRVALGFDLTLHGSLAWQEGEADYFATSTAQSVRAPMTRIAPLSGLLGLRWEGAVPGLHVELFGIFAAPQDRLSPDDIRDTQRIPVGGTPGWATANLRLGYQWTESLKLVAAVENILDEDYRIHGSGINQPGRNFRAGVEYRF